MTMPKMELLEADMLEQVRARCALVRVEHPELERRLEVYFPDFWHSYQALYPAATAERVLHLVDVLLDGLRERGAALRDLDRRREQNPAWFHDQAMVGMMLYVDLFAGSLKGVIDKIPYLRELGVTYLHLMPLLKTREGPDDGGYAVSDYRTVDPSLGTTDELRALARRLHEAGIRLVIDFVMNHTAREHAWAQAALDGDPRFQAFYLMYPDRTLPDAYEQALPEVFPDFAPGNFTYQPAIDRWVWTTFYPFQWDLNYANPDVFEAVFREMLFLANVGVDVLRLDAVPFLWKRMGTNCQNQREAVDVIAAYKALMRMVAPGVLFKAEAIVAPDDVIRYLGVGGLEGRACDIAYNATLMNHLWHALAAENTHLLRTTLATLPRAPRETTWINYVRCHDDIGWGIADKNAAAVRQDGRDTRMFCTEFYAGERPSSYADGYRFQVDPKSGEARISGTAAALAGLQKARIESNPAAMERAIRRLFLLHGVIYFMRGIPVLYSGDELGQLNDFSYLDDPLKAHDNRWLHRPPMDWERAERRRKPETIEQHLFQGLRRLAEVRAAQLALHGCGEETVLIPDNDSLFLVHRHHKGEALLMAANFSRFWQQASMARLPEPWQPGYALDVLTGQRLHFTTGNLVVPPYTVLWLAPADPPSFENRLQLHVELEVPTEPGEQVYLSGNLDALGAWMPEQAVGPLDAKAYPVWRGVIEVPEGAVFEMGWLKKRGEEVVAWSPVSLYGIGSTAYPAPG